MECNGPRSCAKGTAWPPLFSTCMMSTWLAAAICGSVAPWNLLVDGQPIHPSELLVLQELQQAWKRTFEGWDSEGDCKDLYRNLDCGGGDYGSIFGIFLEMSDLTGSIPSSIGRLANLKRLTLGRNRLTGSIPSTIGDLVNLQYIYLEDNMLTGSIPDSIGNLGRLGLLKLSGNQLTGEIPQSIGNLQSLEILDLSHNQLTGGIPSSIGNMWLLYTLDVSNNRLTGIPSSIALLESLVELMLGNNLLTGNIPEFITALPKLNVLKLGGSYGTLRCPQAASVCGVSSEMIGSFRKSLYCTQYCSDFCRTCVPGFLPDTESKGFNASIKYMQGRRNPYFRAASMLGISANPGFRDWRVSGRVFSIKDQGNCSSCWAFSAVAAVESAISITYGLQVVGLSEQQILDCIVTPDNNCGGGHAEAALDYVANTSLLGLLPSDFYPYKGSTRICDVKMQGFIPTLTGVTMYEEVDYFGWFGIVLAVQNQPVIANVHGSHPSFVYYKYDEADPIFKNESCAEGVVDHSVVIIGYDLHSDPPYWIIRNSAGPNWGQGGYMNMRIVSGSGICNIQSSPVLYPVITLPQPCDSPLQPCGAGTCLLDEPPRPGRNRCLCPSGFVSVKNVDNSTSCAPVDACNFFSKNPCGVGTCVNDNVGGYQCICTLGYVTGQKVSNNAPTCVPAVTATAGNLTYVVPVSGITCATVAAAYGLTEEQLRTQNKLTAADCRNLTVSIALNITATRLAPTCNVRYSWSKGDTCAAVAKLTGLITKGLLLLNPWLNCVPDRLPTPGQQLCLNASSSSVPHGTLPRCNLYVAVNSTDTCASIIAKFRITPIKFFALNPGLFCDSIGAQSNHSSELPPIDEVCVDGGPQGGQECLGNSRYLVASRDRCIRIAHLFFRGNLKEMRRLNSGWQCKDSDLYMGRVICIPYNMKSRPPPPLTKNSRSPPLTLKSRPPPPRH